LKPPISLRLPYLQRRVEETSIELAASREQLGGAAREADGAKEELQHRLEEPSIELAALREQLGGAASEAGGAKQELQHRLEESAIELAASREQLGGAAREADGTKQELAEEKVGFERRPRWADVPVGKMEEDERRQQRAREPEDDGQRLRGTKGLVDCSGEMGAPAATGAVFFGRSRPGDWVCPNCGDLQYRKNGTWRMCHAGKPAAGSAAWKEGDWSCPGRGDHQFARNAACRKCGTSKPAGGRGGQPGRRRFAR